jgi:basic membrane lipoprotein Med (substrate-binding protein (PBP1-ABC) superfamily)/class 3 adenylate cyclase
VDEETQSRLTELPRGTVTFLFTDIEGSTRLERELREGYGEVLTEHQRLLRQSFERYAGHEIDTQGDSFFVVFPRARDAVSAAVDAQRAIASHPWPGGSQVRVRMGMHTGEASFSNGRYFGLAVHRAARISAAGHGGQILLSSSTRDVVADDLPPDQRLVDLGLYPLKDLPRSERVFQLAVEGLPSEFPPLKTAKEQELAAAASAALASPWRRRALVVVPLVGAVVMAAVALALVVGRGGGVGGGQQGSTAASRVALVVPRAPRPGIADNIVSPLVDGLRSAERLYGIEGEVLVAKEFDPGDPSVAKARARLRSGDYDLVVIGGGALAYELGPAARRLTDTHFVGLDVPVADLDGFPKATGFVFADDQAGYLAGYLSGLMEGRREPGLNRARIVSTIGAAPAPPVERLVRGFARGARRALPGVTVLTAYSRSFNDQSKCEAIANRQIGAGSDIVFAAAGTCSLGALHAAGTRGVWGVGVDGDRSYLGPHILVSTVKRYDQAVLAAIRSYEQGTLPTGRDIVLGLKDDAVGIAGISADVPESVRVRVEREATTLRRRPDA